MEHVTSSLINNSDDPMGEAVEGTSQPSNFFECAILAPCSKGLSPLHTFFASISGVYDSKQMCLHVSGLPSGFTAQQLLRHFQLQYPSAYRAEVFHDTASDGRVSDSEDDNDERDNSQEHDPEHEHASAFRAQRSKRLSSPPPRSPGDTIVFPEAAPLLASSEIRRYRERVPRRPRRPYRDTGTGVFIRVGGTGYVFFSDIHQLRAALLELDNSTVNTTSHAPGGGPFFGSSTTAHASGRLSVRLAGAGTGYASTGEAGSDSEGEEGSAERDRDSEYGRKAKASINSAISDLKKLHDFIMASKGTRSPTFHQNVTTTSTNNAVSK